MTSAIRISDYQTYWNDILRPDYHDFLRNDGDLRSAFHCAVSLFHMHDWIYRSYRPEINSTVTFLDQHGNAQPVSDASTFANSISDTYPHFELVRGVANSVKHLELTPRRTRGAPTPPRNPAAPTHASNTYFSSSNLVVFGYTIWKSGEILLQMPGGADRPLSDIAESVYLMWPTFCLSKGWPLTT
jgi:hypothetical protein